MQAMSPQQQALQMILAQMQQGGGPPGMMGGPPMPPGTQMGGMPPEMMGGPPPMGGMPPQVPPGPSGQMGAPPPNIRPGTANDVNTNLAQAQDLMQAALEAMPKTDARADKLASVMRDVDAIMSQTGSTQEQGAPRMPASSDEPPPEGGGGMPWDQDLGDLGAYV